MKHALKLGLFLLSVCALIGWGVSQANSLTEPLILEAAKRAQEEGFKEVFPTADEFKGETEKYLLEADNSVIKEVYVAYLSGEPTGVIYIVEPKGYGGAIQTLVGFDLAEKVITNIKVLSHSETPGLGDKVTEPWFVQRFQQKSAAQDLEVVKHAPQEENQVEAITAATITTDAVTSGVNAARAHFVENFLD